MRLLHFRRTFVEKMFVIHAKVEAFKKTGKPIAGYARHYYDLFCLAERPEVLAMLRSDEYAAIKADYDRISTHHFPKSYVPPPDMSFAKSDAMFPPAELRAVLRSEFEAQCRVLCFGPFPDWDHVQASFEGIREPPIFQGFRGFSLGASPIFCSRHQRQVVNQRNRGVEQVQIRAAEAAICEGETLPQRVPNTIYGGTAQTIAGQLEREADEFGWLEDDLAELSEPPLTSGGLDELIGLWPVSDMKLLDFGVPDAKQLPRPDEFQRAVKRCEDSERKVVRIGGRGQQSRVRDLSGLSDEELSSLQNTAKRFAGLLAGLTQRLAKPVIMHGSGFDTVADG